VESEFTGPVNIGSEEMISINQFAEMVMQIAGKKLSIKHITRPLGVRGRNSDNRRVAEKLGWNLPNSTDGCATAVQRTLSPCAHGVNYQPDLRSSEVRKV